MITRKLEETIKRNKLKEEKPYVYEKMNKFDEKLARGESIGIIQFQYNYKCNFKCVHCSIKGFQGKQNKRSFTLDDVRELSRQADELGLARFTITGGEPLIFKDFDKLVEAIDPQKFYIDTDTNGWFLDLNMARHLKAIGIDGVHISLDNLYADDHDDFRKAKGSWLRVMNSIQWAKETGLNHYIQTVVTKQRLYSDEFLKFVQYLNDMDVGVFITYAKPVGAWEGNFDVLINKKDINYVRELEKTHKLFTHLTPGYGRNLGCIAVKGIFSITQYGDVLPCPYIHISIGNVFEEPLKDILERGMNIKYFGKYVDTCLIAEDRKFIDKYNASGRTRSFYKKNDPQKSQ